MGGVVEKGEVDVTAVAIDFDFIFCAHLFAFQPSSSYGEKKMEERKEISQVTRGIVEMIGGMFFWFSLCSCAFYCL